MQPRPCGQDRADAYEGNSVWYVRQRAKNQEADTCRAEASAGLFSERLRKQRKLTWRACQHSGLWARPPRLSVHTLQGWGPGREGKSEPVGGCWCGCKASGEFSGHQT